MNKLRRIELLAFATIFFVALGMGGLEFFLNKQRLQESLENSLQSKSRLIERYFKDSIKKINHKYFSTIDLLLQKPGVIEAFEKGQREILYSLLNDDYIQMKKENPSLDVFHFHTVDNHSFLRFHLPGKQGDDLSGFRHAVVDTNKNKISHAGFEVGIYGVFYRLIRPVFNRKGRHIGSLEVGLVANHFLEENRVLIPNLQMIILLDKAYLLDEEKVSYDIVAESKHFVALKEYENSFFDQKVLALFDGGSKAIIQKNGRYFIPVKDLELKDYKGRPIAKIAACLDVSEEYGQYSDNLRQALMIVGGIVVILTLLIYWIFRIFNKQTNKQYELIRQNEQRLQKAQELAHVGNWEIDYILHSFYWSDELFRIFGEQPGSLSFSYNLFLSYVHPEDRSAVNDAYKESIRQKQGRKMEYSVQRKDGSTRYVLEQWEHVFDEADKLLSSHGTLLDITEIKEVQNRLNELNANLNQEVRNNINRLREQEQMLFQQSKMALMGEMISAIAHQWRQPLNALALEIQDLKEAHTFNEVDEPYIEKLVGKSMDQINYMSKTIDDFRNFFRPNKEKSDFSVFASIAEVKSILAAQLKSHHIFLLTDGEDFLLQGHKSDLSQVLLNIINNAKDAIIEKQREEPAFRGEIVVRAEKSPVRTITIEDNGGGIERAIIDRIFEPYFTTKFEHQGTGIGLYMSKMIVEKYHQGRIKAENGEKGARFTIYFD